jgi:hypothetical protein
MLSLNGPKLRTRKLDQSSRNRHSPQTSVRELSLHPQRHQLHNKSRGQIILTCNTTQTRGLFQRHHLARAGLGHSMARVVLNKSSRGDGRGGDLWVAGSIITCCFQCRSTSFCQTSVVCLHTLTKRMLSFSFPLVSIIFLSFILFVEAGHDFDNPVEASESSHTNNWAVLVCASRYWFNYRVRIVDLLHAPCT